MPRGWVEDPTGDPSAGTSESAQVSVEKQGQCSRVKKQMKEDREWLWER